MDDHTQHPIIETAMDATLGFMMGAATSRMVNTTVLKGGLAAGGFLALKTAFRHAFLYSRGKDDVLNYVASAGAASTVFFARQGIRATAIVAACASVYDVLRFIKS